MGYQEDYKRAVVEMKAALEDLQTAESRVAILQRRMLALQVLMAGDNPESSVDIGMDNALKILRATKRPIDHLRRIFACLEGALTTKELRENLRKVGCDLSRQANPSGTIGALCARLVEQGVIRRTHKAGRIAWQRL